MKVYPLLIGNCELNDAITVKGGDPNKTVWYPQYIYYIDSPERKIVVDTGFGDPKTCLNECGYNCKVEKGMSVEERLKALNLAPSDIDTVIITHSHWDHIGGLNLFTNAQVYCQEEDVSMAIAPPDWYTDAFPRALSDRLPSLKERLKVLHGDVVLEKGITLKKVGAHTPGSQMVSVKSENIEVIITGGILIQYVNLEKNTPPGFFHNLDEWVLAMDYIYSKMKEGKVIVLPPHEPQVWEKYKEGITV